MFQMKTDPEPVDNYWSDVRNMAREALQAVSELTGEAADTLSLNIYRGELVDVIDASVHQAGLLADFDSVMVVLGATHNSNAFAGEITALEEDCNTLKKLLTCVAHYALYHDIHQTVRKEQQALSRRGLETKLRDANWQYDEDRDLWTSPKGEWTGTLYEASEVRQRGAAYEDCAPCLGGGCFRCQGTGFIRMVIRS